MRVYTQILMFPSFSWAAPQLIFRSYSDKRLYSIFFAVFSAYEKDYQISFGEVNISITENSPANFHSFSIIFVQMRTGQNSKICFKILKMRNSGFEAKFRTLACFHLRKCYWNPMKIYTAVFDDWNNSFTKGNFRIFFIGQAICTENAVQLTVQSLIWVALKNGLLNGSWRR